MNDRIRTMIAVAAFIALPLVAATVPATNHSVVRAHLTR